MSHASLRRQMFTEHRAHMDNRGRHMHRGKSWFRDVTFRVFSLTICKINSVSVTSSLKNTEARAHKSTLTLVDYKKTEQESLFQLHDPCFGMKLQYFCFNHMKILCGFPFFLALTCKRIILTFCFVLHYIVKAMSYF